MILVSNNKSYILICLVCFFLIGCSGSQGKISSQNVGEATSGSALNVSGSATKISNSTDNLDENQSTNTSNTLAENIDTSLMSGRYMQHGVLDKNYVINGSKRDEENVTVKNGRILFPQGCIRSICTDSYARNFEGFNPSHDKIKDLIKKIETATVIEKLPEDNEFNRITPIDTRFVFLNSHGEYIIITLSCLGDGYCLISSGADGETRDLEDIPIKSDDGKKYKYGAFVCSKALEKCIKQWISWEDIGDKGFDQIESMVMNYKYAPEKAVELPETAIKQIQKYLKHIDGTDYGTCGDEHQIVAKLKNGKAFHFSISADGDGVSTDKIIYTISNGDEKTKLIKLLNEYVDEEHRANL